MVYHFPTPPMTNSEIDQGAIVDNEHGPSRRRKTPTTKKSQRSLDQDDILNALVKLQ